MVRGFSRFSLTDCSGSPPCPPYWKGQASAPLIPATLAVIAGAVVLSYTPLGPMFGFVPLLFLLLRALGIVVLCYAASPRFEARILQ
jgi:uncharacterized membrane protein